jgi:CHAT domain
MTRADELIPHIEQLTNLSLIRRRLGDEPAANDALNRAAASALAYMQSFTGEWLLDTRSRQVIRVFEELAWAHANAGAPEQALAAIEVIRSATVRLHTMSEAERANATSAMVAPLAPRPVARVVDGEARAYLDREPLPPPDSLDLPAIAPVLERLLQRLEAIPTALVSLVPAYARGLTALICWPDGTIDSEQWTPVMQGVRPFEGYDAPGPFRERRLQAISRSNYEDLFAPVDRRLRARRIERVVLSVPGWLGRFPIEALFDGEAFVGDRYQTLYVPSLRVGADLALSGRAKMRRALVVGYAGDDLPWSRAEQDGIRQHLRGRVTFLAPAACTKRSVLDELEGKYDVIHFCCHASYDDADPINAALHLSPDPQNDRQRITAYELMSAVRFARSPVVTLSACASGVMDLSETSNAYGLVGGLLRAGARCVIGTRWPVYDETAAATMVAMYERQKLTDASSPECLYAVTSEMRKTTRIEDWAAFGCVGIP